MSKAPEGSLKEQLARERAKKQAKLEARAAKRRAAAPSRRFPPGLSPAGQLAWLAAQRVRLREQGRTEERAAGDYDVLASYLPRGDPRPYGART